MISSTAQKEITVKGVHAVCNWPTIKQVVPHAVNYQEFIFFGRSNVGKSSLIN